MNLVKIKNSIMWFLKSFIWLTPLVILIDQISKLLADKYLVLSGEPISIIPGIINFRLEHNKGMAFSILSDTDARWLLPTISVIASIGIIIYLILKYKNLSLFYRIIGYVILGGCMGNAIDRLFFKDGVIDFIEFGFVEFATFNIADSCLVVGILILAIKMIYDDFKKEKKPKVENETNKDN